MSEEITASYLLNTEALMPAMRWHQAKIFRLGGRVIFAVIVLSALVGLFQYGFNGKDIVMAVLLCLLSLAGIWLWLFIMKQFMKYAQVRNLKSIPGYGKMTHWIATETELKGKFDGATSSTPWSQIFKSVETPEGMLVYLQKMLFNWFPKTAFATEADYIRFRDLLAAKTNYSVMK